MYFSVNRKGEYYKCCDKCRVNRKSENKSYYVNNKQRLQEYAKTYREQHIDSRKVYDAERRANQTIIECETCGFEIKSMSYTKHKKTNRCKQWGLLISRIDIDDPEITTFHFTFKDEPIPIYKDYKRTIEYQQQYLGFDPNAKQLSVEEQI